MAAIRKSKQREAVYDELCSRNDHPTAEELYVSLKEAFPNISLATVYRNLRMLAEMGKVNILYTDTSDHFDATVEPHYHLHCRVCDRICDLDIPPIPEIDRIASASKEGTLESYTLMFRGVCKDCLRKNDQ